MRNRQLQLTRSKTEVLSSWPALDFCLPSIISRNSAKVKKNDTKRNTRQRVKANEQAQTVQEHAVWSL